MLTKNDASVIRQIVKEEVKGELKPVIKKITKLQNDLNTTINFFDNDIIRLRKDFDKHTYHPPTPSL